MSSNMYQLEFDEQTRLLTMTLHGFWTMEVFERYKMELLPMMRQVRAKHGPFRLLSHATAMPIQPPEISEAFTDLTPALVDLSGGPIAILAGSTLNKVQAARALAHERIRVFLDETEARNWLFGEDAAIPN
jgi:hypothetical protein